MQTLTLGPVNTGWEALSVETQNNTGFNTVHRYNPKPFWYIAIGIG